MALSDIDKSPLYIDSTNGRVGIGTSSPSRQLHINDASESNIRLQGSSDYAELRVKDADNAFSFHFGGAERMRIDSNGNVGIGTSSPSDKLSLEVGAANAGLSVYYSGVEVGSFRNDAGNATINANNASLKLATGGTERMRIDTSGNLLVGTTDNNVGDNSGSSNGGINIGTAGVKGVISAAAGQTVAYLNRLGSDGGIIDFRKDGSTVGDIGVNNSDNLRIQGNSGHSGIEFGTNAIFPHKNSSNVDATIDLGESTLRWKNLYLSGGVYLGGTGSANHLDDYEEGTITNLRIYFDTDLSNTSSTGASYVTASGGIYTKIGRLVTVQFYWAGTYNANQVLLKHMENLPFTVGSSNNGFYGGNTSIPYHRGFSGYYRYNTATDYSNNINLIVTPGTTTAQFKSWAHSYTSTGWPLMNAGAGQELSASLTYMTD